jgi:hypothetical protein
MRFNSSYSDSSDDIEFCEPFEAIVDRCEPYQIRIRCRASIWPARWYLAEDESVSPPTLLVVGQRVTVIGRRGMYWLIRVGDRLG